MAAEFDEIHDALRDEPEQTWDRLARYLCASVRGPATEAERLARTDLIEDLMFFHADAFIDRFEALLNACPELRKDVATAHVGGVAEGPGLKRFYELQDSVEADLEASGELAIWRRLPDASDKPGDIPEH